MTKAEKRAWADKLWVTWCEVGFGCTQYMAFHPEYVAPVGVVWVVSCGGPRPVADVLHSYVLPFYRRRGVRTRINQTILEHHAVIQTKTGSKDGGAAFMKAAGYTHDKTRGDWYLLRKGKQGK